MALRWLLAVTVLLVAVGCAQPPRTAAPAQRESDLWTGRMALRVDADQAQSFSAGFVLRGNAQTGQLSLHSPLGSTLAHLEWTPGDARLRWDGQQRQFESLEALTRQATGTELPVASIFQWLAGNNTTTAGWQADLDGLPNGRLVARRSQPLPAVEMRLIIDP